MPDDFENFLTNRLRERGMSVKKLSELTGIPLSHLEALGRGDFAHLPAMPYIYGYLKKIGAELEFDFQPWWEHFQKSGVVRSSGVADQLPQNRFTRKPLSWKVWVVLIAAILLGYVIFRFALIIGRPNLIVDYPPTQTLATTSGTLIVSGKFTNGDQLTVNGEGVPFEKDGAWHATLTLVVGTNKVEITAKKFLGGEVKITREVMYTPAETLMSPLASSTAP